MEEELGINTTNVSLNSIYIQSTDSFDEILKSHCKCIESVAFEMYEEDTNLPYLYWTPELNKVPVTLKLASIKSNSMWIVKNSTSLLPSLDQLDIPTATSVQTYYFSILYTSIPHNLLKPQITALVHNSFKKRDGSNRYKNY